jgi:hypothetical protein
MTKMLARYREAFDPGQDFVIMRPLRLDGVALAEGTIFDKTKVPTRRLRQLFDQRALSYPHETGRDRCRPPNPNRPIIREQKAVAPAQNAAEAHAVDIPADWRGLRWARLLHLASQFSSGRLMNKPEAEAAIEAELARRAKAA